MSTWRKVLLAASPSIALLGVTLGWNAWDHRAELGARARSAVRL